MWAEKDHKFMSAWDTLDHENAGKQSEDSATFAYVVIPCQRTNPTGHIMYH